MEYLFMATHNPAYRFFTMKFFTEGGIDYVDKYMNLDRAHPINRELSSKKLSTHVEQLFCKYIGQSNFDPLLQLGGKGVLEMIYDKLNVVKMQQLESQFPVGEGVKLVFTNQDIALRIFDFYNVTLREILAEDLQNPNPRNLYNHIQIREDDILPDARLVGKERVHEAASYDRVFGYG